MIPFDFAHSSPTRSNPSGHFAAASGAARPEGGGDGMETASRAAEPPQAASTRSKAKSERMEAC